MPKIFGLSPETHQKIAQTLQGQARVQKVWIYGSRAKGNFRPGSDIDLCLEGTLELEDLLQIRSHLDDLDLPYSFDLSIKALIHNPALLDHIQRCGLDFLNPSPN